MFIQRMRVVLACAVRPVVSDIVDLLRYISCPAGSLPLMETLGARVLLSGGKEKGDIPPY